MRINIPPLALCALCAGLMYLLSKYTWSYGGGELARLALLVVSLAISCVFVLLGTSIFKKKNTTINPVNPDRATYLVTSGVYSISRNPMYVGFVLSLFGWFIFLGNIFSLSIVVAFAMYINYVQIPNEEEALMSLFGEQYTDYKNRVRRWV